MNQMNSRSAKHVAKQMKREGLKKLLPLFVMGFVITPVVGLLETAQVEVQAAEQTQTTDRDTLIEQFGTSAQKAADKKDLYASVMTAQALLETGYGSSSLSQAPYHNLFGVKEYGNDASVKMATGEYLNGQWTTEMANFAAYNSFEESFADHAKLLHTAPYQAAWKSNAKSYQTAANSLTGHYATDPDYGAKLIKIIENYDLARFDNEVPRDQDKSAKAAEKTYKVQAGDTLTKIAAKHNQSVEQLTAKNQLADHLIYSGQTLKV